jgi:hypothetical protein
VNPLELIHAESGADRQRRIYRHAGNWQAVLKDLKERWSHELDEALAEAGMVGANI